MCRGCRAVRFWKYVLFAPIGFTLIEWQERWLRNLYGNVRIEDGLRQYRRAYGSVAKKNGKSFIFGGMPAYHLTQEVDQEPGPLEAYGAAAAKDQASIVFRSTLRLLQNSVLRDELRIIESTKRIVRRDGRGFYQVLSSDGDVQDGIEPSLFMADELHRWKTAKARTLFDVGTKGTISRREPIFAAITTAAEEFDCPLWEREHERAQKIQDGIIPAGRYYSQIHAADKYKLDNNPEYWKSKEARLAANPSHEDHGGFLQDEALIEELNEAIEDQSKKPAYVRYHLNSMVNRSEQAAIDMDRWKANQEFDLRKWPTYDAELLIRKWGLLNKPCYCGVDVSKNIDLTAAVFVFPPDDADGIWTVLPFAWVPEMRSPRAKVIDYTTWIAQGWIEACAGWEIRNGDIKDRIGWGREMFDLKEVCLDPWNGKDLRQNLEDDGYTAIEIGQTYKFLSDPTKKVLALYLGGKLRHGNNPVFNWAASCATTAADKKDNIMFGKPDTMKTSKRIDPLAAAVNGFSRAMVATSEKPFQGLIVV